MRRLRDQAILGWDATSVNRLGTWGAPLRDPSSSGPHWHVPLRYISKPPNEHNAEVHVIDPLSVFTALEQWLLPTCQI